ncbi:cytochrome P450 [Cercophora newfieldiana]|uniref:Cytochrome P450 n=1 Tax=Cercophora newfieldiana TaxID=92897 RepID=A0AA39YC18_9PEZI|nr:cytochrome P450 [Cercophora newfieldiana]
MVMQQLSQLSSATIWILVGSAIVFLVLSQITVQRKPLPKGAPPLIKPGAGDWPVLGSLRYFSDRQRFMLSHIAESITGSFSFYFGKHHIVGLGGIEGKKTFFESKHLDFSEGYAVLFTGTPTLETDKNDEPIGVWFTRTLTTMIKADNLSKSVPNLVETTHTLLQRNAPKSPNEEAVMDPFVDIYRTIYALTMRTVGAAEIYNSPKLMDKTLRWFEQLQNASALRIIFPFLPTYADLTRMIAGGRIYFLLKRLVEERKRTGRREEDPLQYLIDTGDGDVKKVISLVLGSLFAGLINSGINAAYVLCWLATTPEWYQRVQKEVDGVVEAHRLNPQQSAMEVLATLSLKEWETSFPFIEMCQRETIRHHMTGTTFRKNTSNIDVPIGKTGEFIPRGSFAVYHLDDLHFNPEYYPEPEKWNPGRFIPEHEGTSPPLPYVGWGTGRHPCVGMKFAKLEIYIIIASFVAMFDYTLEDDNEKPLEAVPAIDRKPHGSSMPLTPLRLRYRLRT